MKKNEGSSHISHICLNIHWSASPHISHGNITGISFPMPLLQATTDVQHRVPFFIIQRQIPPKNKLTNKADVGIVISHYQNNDSQQMFHKQTDLYNWKTQVIWVVKKQFQDDTPTWLPLDNLSRDNSQPRQFRDGHSPPTRPTPNFMMPVSYQRGKFHGLEVCRWELSGVG